MWLPPCADADGDCAEELETGTNPAAVNAADIGAITERSKPDATIGTAIGRSIALIRPMSPDTPDNTSACDGSSTNARARPRSRDQMSSSSRGEAGHDSDTGRVPGVGACIAVASTISAIGVMPQIGSVENCPSAYETAPINRPST